MADYKKIYNDAYASLEDQYNTQKQALEDEQAKEKAVLDEQKRVADTRLLDTRNEALRQAYISRMQNQRDMPGLMAAQGLSGGASETAIASIMRGYQNSRNAANKEYGTNQTTLDTDYNANSSTLGTKYTQLLNDLQNQRNNDAIAQAQLQYQAEVQREQIAAQNAANAAQSSGWSGGVGGNETKSKTYPTVASNGAWSGSGVTSTAEQNLLDKAKAAQKNTADYNKTKYNAWTMFG
jgi:hypothetical protein